LRTHKIVASLLGVVAVSSVLVPATSASPPTRGPTLASYVNAVRPLAVAFTNADQSAVNIKADIWSDVTANGNHDIDDADLANSLISYADDLAPVGPRMLLVAPRLAAIRPPVALRATHADLSAAVRTEGAGLKTYVAILQAQPQPDWVSVFRADSRFNPVLTRAHALAKSWRQELVAALRRSGMAVPFWLKQVGA
jgi:hypothetical protein